MRLPVDCLWKSFSPKEEHLHQVKEYLTGRGFLTGEGRWNNATVIRDHFETKSPDKEATTFAILSDIFNAVRDCLRPTHPTAFVKTMVNAGSVRPESTRISSSQPDAFLRVDANGPLKKGSFRWRDLTCPFEYKFGRGDTLDVRRENPGLAKTTSPSIEQQEDAVGTLPYHALRPPSNVLVRLHGSGCNIPYLVIVPSSTFQVCPF
jgi:hypothetical protein